MKVATSALLLGAATALADQQQVFQIPKPIQDATEDVLKAWQKPLESLQDALKTMTAEARQVWDEVAMKFPDAMEKANLYSHPKPHTRKEDSQWDHITKGGAGSNSAIVQDSLAEKQPGIFDELDAYSLRSKNVDPNSLGVDSVKQYSGYLDDIDKDKHLFYWFFESRHDPKHDPVILWLNGGPGCSSLTGLFMELGPSSITKDGQVKHNPFSWNRNASIIFLDQPVNVGYSYSGGAVSNTVAASRDVYALLSLFFKQFPEYSTQDFHIAGESYAGHYIPVFAHEILSHKDRNINLKSIMIGNGLTDGYTQYEYYKPMACGQGGWPAVLGERDCQAMEEALPHCKALIKGCYNNNHVWNCVPAAVYCNNAMLGPYQKTGQNVYDVRGKCQDPSNLCYSELGWISNYLNKENVKEALGVEVSSYDSCNNDINRNFLYHGDWMQPFHRHIPAVLEQIPVLIYAGDADFICNWLGNKAWTEALEWKGKKDFAPLPLQDLKLGGKGRKTGEVKSHGNFTFVRLHAAGHMVPYDQPEASLDMLNRWISGEWFSHY